MVRAKVKSHGKKIKGFAPICFSSFGLRDGLVARVKVRVGVQVRGSGLGS
jgi:hypothetical protein